MKAIGFLGLLEKNGFNFFTGVPCSYLSSLCQILNQRDQSFHVPAVREDIAVGLAAGAYLAGKFPVIYMQNSGLGYSLEAFASLQLIYYIPALVLLSYRGPEDQGWEEHLIMGKHTEDLLNAFHMKYSIFRGKISAPEVKGIKGYLLDQGLPYFLLITKGALE
ncbi:MAG: sulfopyruvate decarboxylase subunit alpha [Deltaproteobacteria bacterium]|nr:sulfopyruvate decarboxylase subunit alpha [Deltaproteobacteria bacterium]